MYGPTKTSEHSWEDLHDLYQTGETICQALKSGVDFFCSKEMSTFERLDLLRDVLRLRLTLVQVIVSSSDNVLVVMQETPSEQWLTHLFVQNFLTVCMEHFDITFVEEEACFFGRKHTN